MRVFLLLAIAAATQVPQVTSDACTSCHSAEGHDSHPVGIAYVAMATLRPKPVALLVKGNVECVSCHYAHDETTETKSRIRTTTTTTDLCESCHRVE